MRGRRAALLALASLSGAPALRGQAAPPAAVPGSELVVSVVTVGAGAAVWERWGHNMIRVRDTRTGLDVVYNYGMFDFGEKGFLLHFLEGRLNYWSAGFYTSPTIAFYERVHRSLWEQVLRLTPDQRLTLRQFLDWNALPEHRYYRYDYYRDNCSTRVRDALDRVLGGAIARATRGRPTGTTYRDHTRRLTQDDPFLRTGLMLLLGPAIDRPIDEWEEMFLPVQMMGRLREVTVDSAGKVLPLVVSEDTIYTSDRFPEPTDRGPMIPWFLLTGLGLGAAVAFAGRPRADGRLGWWFTAGVGLVTLVLGIGGLVATGLWALTDHAATYNNQNVLQANLVALVLAFTLRGVRLRRPGAVRLAQGLSLFIAAGSVAGLLWHLVHGGQANGDVLALLVPVNLGVAASVWWGELRGTSGPSIGT
ncbi:MAG TPA: DUF4105 domain-containing protein [Gemmatimonadales bacterium]|nr:DUF4105 domain-containing protein [Gemmatimonadales bacterium]